MRITSEVAEMLESEAGRQKLIALKICELVEIMKGKQPKQNVSLWEAIFGHKGNC